MSRNVALMLLTLLTLSSLVMGDSVFSQLIPKPSSPEFTMNLEAHPYYVPPAYEINPYTGENRTIHNGYTVENKSLVFTIKNQPFSPYTDTEGNLIEVFYNIHAKGYFEDYWTDLGIVNSSNSEYTIETYAIGENAHTEILGALDTGYIIDFQVRTQVGYYKINYVSLIPMGYSIIGETSDWSNIQTLTVGEFQTFTPSPEPTTPTSPPSQENLLTQEQSVILGLTVTVAVIITGLGLLVYLVKRK